MVGNGVRKLIERAAGGADPGVVERVLADYKRIYRESCLEFASVYDGMPKVINRLKSAGIPLFVVTNKPHEQALIIVEHLYGKGIFDGIYGGREGMKIKPDPTLTLGLLAQAGAKPGNSLFVGDSDVDIYTAANAGMKSAGVLWGFRGKDELLSAGADYLVKKPPQLLSVGIYKRSLSVLILLFQGRHKQTPDAPEQPAQYGKRLCALRFLAYFRVYAGKQWEFIKTRHKR